MTDKAAPVKKRLVKNPETFRERAIKAGEDGGRPKSATRLRTASSKIIRPLVRPVALAAHSTARVQSLRPLHKLLKLIGYILLPVYFRRSWQELRLVEWPSRKQSRQLTFAVLVFAVVFGVVIAIVDYGLDRLFRDILLK